MFLEVVAAALPDPGSPEFPAILGFAGAFAGTLVALLEGKGWDGAEPAAFQYGFLVGGLGIATYLFGLVTGLY